MIQLQNKRKRWCTPFIVTGIAITLSIVPGTLRAQDRDSAQTPNATAGANASVNVSQDESKNLDQFLGSHPEITRQLQSNPALVNDPEYLRANPELRDYLQQHPQLQSALRENAAYLLHRQDQQGQSDARGNAGPQDNDDRSQADNNNRDDERARIQAEIDRRNEESARIDQFLADHPNIDKDLKSNPAWVNDDKYLKKHEELDAFLRNNPNVRDECGRNPAYFEDRELRAQLIRTNFNLESGFRYDDMRPGAPDEDRRAEFAQFDRFLDTHPEIGEQLRKDPSLADNHQFVQDHPALQAYLQDNPAIRDQLGRDPNAFMHQEDQLNHVIDDRDRDRFASFREFLNEHPRIAADVSKDPACVKDHDYVQRNPELAEYLNGHPDVRDAWSASPQSFVRNAQQSTTGSGMPSSSSHTGDAGTGAAPNATPSATSPQKPKQ
jgi:hypothetical protein